MIDTFLKQDWEHEHLKDVIYLKEKIQNNPVKFILKHNEDNKISKTNKERLYNRHDINVEIPSNTE